MTLHIRAAELDPAARTDGDAALLRTLDELAHAALDDMRALIFELHPTLLDTHGLVAAVREQAAWITRRGGPAVTVDGPDERLEHRGRRRARRLPAGAGGAAQLREARRATHVQCGSAGPTTTRRTLLLEVADDGVGFDPAVAAPGLGLVSMRERAERLGGQLVVAPRPGRRDGRPAASPRVSWAVTG